jgi:hypothetical protein
MMDQTPGTLFDRLVARAIEPARDVALPLPPAFDTWGEKVDERVSSAPESRAERIGENTIKRSPSPAQEAPLRQARVRRDMRPRDVDRWQPDDSSSDENGRKVVTIAPPDDDESADALKPSRAPRPTREPVKSRRDGDLEPHLIVASSVASSTVPADQPVSAVPAPRGAWLGPAVLPMVGRRAVSIAPDDHVVRSPADDEATARALPVVQPNLPTLIPEPSRQAPPIHAAPAEAIVHVTIGRLEIRSGEKSRPPRPREQTASTSSLEQYLTRRRGGAS